MKKWIALIVSTLVIAGLITFSIVRRMNQYTIVQPEKGNIHEAIYGLGKVKSRNRFEVIAGVMSTVTKRFVNEGDFVKKGAPLLQLNEQVIFRSPLNGTVTFSKLYEGETALPNVVLLRVEDLNEKFIELSLEQQSVLRIKLDQPARISFESLRGQTLNGKVAAVFPRDDEFIVQVDAQNLDSKILPGMTADVTIDIGSIENATILPIAAIRNGMISLDRGNGHWEKTKVEIGQIDGLSAEIKSPQLTPQDRIRIRKED